jgi:hypothetical protein
MIARALACIDILLSMQCDDVVGRPQRQPSLWWRDAPRTWQLPQESVHHHVADHVHTLADALASQISHRRRRGTEEKRGYVIGQPTVDLLRHPGVEASQPSLHVRDRDPALDSGERPRQRGVRVAVHEHQIGAHLLNQQLERSSIRPVIAPWSPEWMPRLRYALRNSEFAEEHRGHRVVVVLAGVDEHLAHAGDVTRDIRPPPSRTGAERRPQS